MTYPDSIGEMTLDELKHYGVKGMKWGVRKDAGHEGERVKTKKLAKLDKQYEKSVSGMKGWVKVQNAFADSINPKLDALNANPKYAGVNMLEPKNKKIYDSYLKDYESAVKASANEAMKAIGTNASGTKRLEVRAVGEGENMSWEAELKEIQHAVDTEGLRLVIKPKFGKDGKIVGQDIQFITDEGSASHDALMHYGVKGMKWGVRRDKKTGVRPIAKALDESAWGKMSKRNVARYESSKAAKKQPKTKITNQQIRDARVRQASRLTKIVEADVAARTAVTKKGEARAMKILNETEDLFYNSRDAKIAAKWTTREKVGVVAVGTLLAPGLGTAAGVGGIILNNRRTRLED